MNHAWTATIVASSILLSGPMVFGYAVLDELALYAILAYFFWCAGRQSRQIQNESVLIKIHRGLFVLCAGYLAIESLRGIFALEDIRVLRFTALFVAAGAIAWLVKPVADHVRFARTVALAGIAYFTAYFAAGIVSEWFFGQWRFNFQGYFWSGTTAAVFPAIIMSPALIVLAAQQDSRDRRLFWAGFATLMITAFYWQSRLSTLIVIAFIALGSFTLGIRRTVYALVIWLGFILILPWQAVGPLPPPAFLNAVYSKMTHLSVPAIMSDISSYGLATFGGALEPPLPPAPVSGGRADDLSVPQQQRDYTDRDIDRKIAFLAALRFWQHEHAGTFIFGTGYYTHRYLLLESIRKTAADYGYQFPDTYRTIVRTSMANGIIIDTGLLGVLLFASLFVCTGLTILANAGWRNLFKPGPQLVALASLLLIVIAMNVGAIYDVVLLYLAVMPHGALIAMLPKTDDTIS